MGRGMHTERVCDGAVTRVADGTGRQGGAVARTQACGVGGFTAGLGNGIGKASPLFGTSAYSRHGEKTEGILHTLARRTASPGLRCRPTRTRSTAAVPTGQTSTSWRCVLLRGQFRDEQRPKNQRPETGDQLGGSSGQDSDSYTYAYETPADDDVSPQSHLVDPPRVWSPQASNGRLQFIP